MFSRVFVAALALCAGVLMSGCYSPAHRLEVSVVKKVRPGMSRPAVEKIMGAPAETVLGSNGKTVARYYFHEYRRLEDSSRYKQFHNPGEGLVRTLSLLYDGGGTLERKLHDESVTPIQRDMNRWVQIGPQLGAGALSRINRGKDRSEDVIQIFGEPMSRSLDPQGRVLLQWVQYREHADYLGQPTAKLLTVVLEGNVVADFSLTEADPRVWFRNGRLR
jgi:hypothetical protein